MIRCSGLHRIILCWRQCTVMVWLFCGFPVLDEPGRRGQEVPRLITCGSYPPAIRPYRSLGAKNTLLSRMLALLLAGVDLTGFSNAVSSPIWDEREDRALLADT
jgi:hypothetical protein